MRGQDQKFLAAQPRGFPTHGGIHGPAEKIARGPLAHHLACKWKEAARAGGMSWNFKQLRVVAVERVVAHHRIEGILSLPPRFSSRLPNLAATPTRRRDYDLSTFTSVEFL